MSKCTVAVLAAILVGAGTLASAPWLFGADAAPATQPADAPKVDPKPVNTKCPVTGEDIDPKVSTVYDGKTIGFCCSDCIKAFNKNPDKYAANIK